MIPPDETTFCSLAAGERVCARRPSHILLPSRHREASRRRGCDRRHEAREWGNSSPSSTRIYSSAADHPPDVDYFTDPKVGSCRAVGRYGGEPPLLEPLGSGAILLDGHFIIEQRGAELLRALLNFNGTAGIVGGARPSKRRGLAARHPH